MSRPNRNNGLTAFLEAKGVLTNGTPEEIDAAKREYRKLYERAYKQRYRKAHSEVRFTLAASVMRRLASTAGNLGVDRSTYAKEATLARLDGVAPRSDQRVDREVLQKVVLIHSEVRHLCRHRPTGFLERRVLFDRLAERISALEEAFREIFNKP